MKIFEHNCKLIIIFSSVNGGLEVYSEVYHSLDYHFSRLSILLSGRSVQARILKRNG